jgi:hypothetical protein
MQEIPQTRRRLGAFLAQGLVIVVSVLFALAVDRAVMGWDREMLERSYLQGLADDFAAAERDTRYALNSAATRDTAAQVVLATLRGLPPTELDGYELARALELAGWVIDVQVSRNSWDDMIATGRLGILEDDGLRREISEFYAYVDQLQTYARDWVEMAREFSDAARSMLDPELRVAIGTEFIYASKAGSRPPAPDAADLARVMRAEPALLSSLGDVLLINKVSTESYGDLVESAQRIRGLIDEELRRWPDPER